MKLNTNNNAYIIIYSAILVVIVAFLLAFVYQALKPMQDANVALDQKKQILNSLNLRNLDGAEAEAMYGRVVKSEEEIDGNTYYLYSVNNNNGSLSLSTTNSTTRTFNNNGRNSYSYNGGWNNCEPNIIIDERTAAKHTVLVKMAPGSEKLGFTIVAMGYSI